jgi:UPF0042 nucleotide-binding protein
VDDRLPGAQVEDQPTAVTGSANGRVGGGLPGRRARRCRNAAARDTDLVIVTGVSGGGRSTVARALENVGFYVVDNLPQVLLLDMAELAFQAGRAARHTAMVLDVRAGAFTIDLGAR